jgi:prepilin-type N-terminal cleavage/methylation domain-containing protein
VHRPPQTSRSRHRGVSLVELLIGLAITAVLLAAVAIAFDGSFESYEQNQELADALHSSRVLSHQIMNRVRRSTYLNVADSGTRIEVEVPDENYQYIYEFSPEDSAVTLSRMNLDTLVTENLGTVDNVTSFTVPSSQWMSNPARLTLGMTVRVGANEATTTSSAVPRQTITF